MNQKQLRQRRPGRRLRMNQDLDPRLGVIQLRLNRESEQIQFAPPIVPGNGKQVRIPDEWDERLQQSILDSSEPRDVRQS